jgi:hypothetical protein
VRLYDLQFGRFQGTLTNMSPADDWVRSPGQYCLDFDATNDVVTVSHAEPLSITSGITVCAWIYPYSLGGGYRNIACKRVGGGSPTACNYQLNLHTTAGALEWYNLTEYVSTYVPTANTWTHVAGTVTASGRLDLWANGRSIYNTTGVTRTANAGLLHIGARPVDFAESFNGRLDDIAIYNRALSGGEMRILATRRGIAYEARRNQDYGSSGFQAAWARQRAQLIGGGV